VKTFRKYAAEKGFLEYETPEKVTGHVLDPDPLKKEKMSEEEEFEWLSKKLAEANRIFKLTQNSYLYWQMIDMHQRLKKLKIALNIKHKPASNAA
jgi:hypothetical protein